MRKYDVFISYRRDGGADTAKNIRDSLVEKGYRVFFDLESLRAGPFNSCLLEVIEEADDFVLILPPAGLDRCNAETDWVRIEIEHAIATNRTIIPVMLKGFEFPDVLPAQIDRIRHMNGIKADIEFYDAYIKKLISFLTSTKRKRIKKRWSAVLALAVVLSIGAFSAFKALTCQNSAPAGEMTGESHAMDVQAAENMEDVNGYTIDSQQSDAVNGVSLIGDRCYIITESGNARSGPGQEYSRLAYVQEGESYIILDTAFASNGRMWFKISVDGCLCWISGGIATVNDVTY